LADSSAGETCVRCPSTKSGSTAQRISSRPSRIPSTNCPNAYATIASYRPITRATRFWPAIRPCILVVNVLNRPEKEIKEEGKAEVEEEKEEEEEDV